MFQVKLERITKTITDEEIKLLIEWRKKNAFAYATRPEITLRSMNWWLGNHVFNKKRYLYWVVVNGEKIGHMGLYNFKDDSCEIDNVSRGVEKYKGVMSEALNMLVQRARRRVKTIYLRVLEDNQHAIDFYAQNGFKYLRKVEATENKKFVKMIYENS